MSKKNIIYVGLDVDDTVFMEQASFVKFLLAIRASHTSDLAKDHNSCSAKSRYSFKAEAKLTNIP
jgi:hypothetical protein